MSLPLLESMVPALTPARLTAATPRTRLACIYVPHGATMYKWTPEGEGRDFAMPEILSPLEKYRDRLTVVSNLYHSSATGADAGAEHARSAAIYLSGGQPQRTPCARASPWIRSPPSTSARTRRSPRSSSASRT
jgi:hypothetical protein